MRFTNAQIQKVKEANRLYAKDRIKKQRRQTQENIWYKLFMLQNYTLTMDMFKGSPMRWKTICTYGWFIRQIYQGKFDEYKTNVKYTRSMLNYIKGLIDSGVEPYPAPNTKSKTVSIKYLIDNKIINSYQIKQIYEPVSTMDNLPDTSISCNRESNSHSHESNYTGTFYRIVSEEQKASIDNKIEYNTINKVTNPLDNKKTFNPWKLNNYKDFSLVETFKQFIKN